MEYDTKTPQWQTSDKLSFAYPSARDRWPVILVRMLTKWHMKTIQLTEIKTQGIDDVHRAVSDATDPVAQKEGKAIIEQLAKLKYELQHNRNLTPLEEDGYPDIAEYNKELEQRGSPQWFDVTWLYSECYIRMSNFFKLSTKWKNYDLFAKQKMSGFHSSRRAVIELATRYKDIVTQLETKHTLQGAKSPEELEQAEKVLFSEMCEICLWGNATDLSLMTNLSSVDFSKIQGAAARKASEKNVLANDLGAAFEALNNAKKANIPDRRVDFVLDNAGFELFVDLILASYLLAAGLATSVVLHPKNIPWFVSDVTPKDFGDLLSVLADPQAFYSSESEDDKRNGTKPDPLSDKEIEEIQFLFQHWGRLHGEGGLVIRPNLFWTGPGSFWRLPKVEPELYNDLKASQLVIFKGDLNYRKLTADAMWDPATPFSEAIGPLGPGSGLRVMTLRTCKGDVICGLPKGKDEELRATDNDTSGARKWAWTGKYAVIQFNNGKA
ncbi:DUF89 domain-containing protein [Pseudovirgaria hyperparasitica]|uniref:Sugar phosphate phosphatase n=1 Tax=Pseudovirgaria hyperparasitica TaxID=470096 RepID=A0A6A6W4E9_9PEZI|nr:DUF89 domain-containing protein [Pseudovirgaria hyperparasitica]KAF2755921.1 DUF89 domain-containing protein [Pseudovirgaria hyperparasitica]